MHHDRQIVGVVPLSCLLLGLVELAGGTVLSPLISGLPSNTSWLGAGGHRVLDLVGDVDHGVVKLVT